MSVIDRLKRLTGEQVPREPAKAEVMNDLRRRIETIMSRRESFASPERVYRGDSVPLESVVTGEEVCNRHGAFFFCRTRHAGSDAHGDALIGDLTELDMPAAALLANQPCLEQYTIHDALFLDTETTGLSGGTGTLAFLIGLGWFEGRDFITCQLLARDFSEECAMLAFIQECAASKQFLITFNGRAFDVNLLSARFVLNRLNDPLTGKPHLDLLNPARRILSHRTSNCRLVTLEAEVLGFARIDDIPGWEIPQRYFDWLRTRNAGLLADIFEHNRYDVVSMAALAGLLTAVLAGSRIQDCHSGDLLAAARLQHERGNSDASRKILDHLIERQASPHATEALKLLSLIHKRYGQWSQSVSIWESILAANRGDLFAAQELAKWCEHRIHDYARAAELVEQAMNYAHELSANDLASLAHRLKRLVSKQGL